MASMVPVSCGARCALLLAVVVVLMSFASYR
jgi:hypothetical protein